MKKTTVGVSDLWQFGFLAVLSVALIVMPDLAFAVTNNAVGNAICDISDSFTGQVATGIGTIAICTLGCLACLGKVQWQTVVVCAVGVALLFGTTAILATLASAGGGNVTICS